MNAFRQINKLKRQSDDLKKVISLAELLLDEKIPLDICRTNDNLSVLIVPANKRITITMLKNMVKYKDFLYIDPSPIRNRVMQVLHLD